MERDAALTDPCELTVVIPTFNERENVSVLLKRLRTALQDVSWQAIFVDDNSPDGTAGAIKAIASTDPRVVCLKRVGRRGLAGAVLEGAMASASPYVAVIDADLQHDETLLPKMLESLRRDEADLAIGTREMTVAGLGVGLSPVRQVGSRVANWLARKVLRAEISDPVSGFFMIRRQLIDDVAPHLSSQGFKVLFDIIASQSKAPRIMEFPYVFAERQAGDSKMDGRVIIEYLGLILSKMTGNIVPPRALIFFLVGASGLVVQLVVVNLCRTLGLPFMASQVIGAATAMTSNFLINNLVTYRDRRLRGLKLIGGYVRFCALCGVGLVANVAVANLVHEHTPMWWLASAAGAFAGAAWNYVSTSLAVW